MSMSDAWKCKCATLSWYGDGTGRRYSGEVNADYMCEAKRFFTSMMSRDVVTGGWARNCRNFTCEAYSDGKCTAHGRDEWCHQCIWSPSKPYADRCTCDPEHCPFFKARTAAEWMKESMYGAVPLLTRNGTLRQEAKAAKRHFKLSDGDLELAVSNRRHVLNVIEKKLKEAR